MDADRFCCSPLTLLPSAFREKPRYRSKDILNPNDMYNGRFFSLLYPLRPQPRTKAERDRGNGRDEEVSENRWSEEEDADWGMVFRHGKESKSGAP